MAILPTDPILQSASAQATASATQEVVSDTLLIKTTPILPTQAPDLKVGDLIQFLVKSVKPNNTGLLYFFGQLIEAKIPPDLKSGDIIKAEVQKDHNSVVLKIKEIIAAVDATSTADNAFIIETDSNLTELLSHKVEFLLKTLDTVLNKNKLFTVQSSESQILVPFPTVSVESPDNLILRELEKNLQILQKIIPKDSQLIDSKQVKDVLKNIQDGSLIERLNTSITQLTVTLDKSSVNHEGKFLIELVKRLYPLKDTALDSTLENSPEYLNQELNKLLVVIGKELTNNNSPLINQIPSKITFRTTLLQLKLALENLQNLDSKSEKANSLESLIKQTEAHIKSAYPIDLQTKEDIVNISKKMLSRLDSLVQSQEMLNRLEPILQTLKEPQLLLFPFLLTGMFGFGELIVDPDGSRQSNKEKNKNNQDKAKKTFAYQGVIPLPNLGQVQFNAMQTENEIELNFTLEDEEKKKFFENNLTDLRAELLNAGITTNNISLNTFTIKKPTVEGLEIVDPLVIL